MKKLTIPAFLIILCLIPATASSQMFSLWGDELMSDCDVSVGQFETYTIYVFLDPGPDGAFAAEYKLELPDSHVCISSEQNTFISGAVIGLPTGPPGVQAPFLSCQNSDVWLYKHTIIVLGERAQHLITLAPHDDTQFMGIATCPGTRPLVDCSVYIHFGVNISCANPCWWPWLETAEAILRDKVTASFDSDVYIGYDPYAYQFESHFKVCSIDDPPDTIGVIDGEWVGVVSVNTWQADSCFLTLERSMLGGVQYKLMADVLSGTMGQTCRETSEMEFTCSVIATQLQQFSASTTAGTISIEWSLSSIDPGTVFHLLRRESDEQFSKVGEMPGTAEELSYTFEDRSVSGGRKYIYRVEYISDTDSGILFETDAVETAPVPVTLAQNHPNPFNPSTTIEFYIPVAGQVSLRVFDVSGRLVRTLVDTTMEPGTHSVTWNGLDENGTSVPSGVYFSRFRTDKTTLSKKMILLR